MDLLKILKLIAKYKLLLLIGGLLTLIISGLVSVTLMQNNYRATASMMIGNTQEGSDLTYNDYYLNVSLVESYRVICKTDNILNKVMKTLGEPMTKDQLRNKITVDSVKNTEIIRINVVDKDPSRAALIANSTAQVFENEIPSIMKMDNVQIINKAAVPTAPYSPNRKAVVLLSLLCFFVFCGGLITVIEALDFSVRTEAQLSEITHVAVLCCVPHMKISQNEKKYEN